MVKDQTGQLIGQIQQTCWQVFVLPCCLIISTFMSYSW